MTGPVRDSRRAAPPEVRFGADGLVPAVVQDAADGRVLMLAWMDAEALAATLATGEVHFHSRSRGRLWRKGETSGNVLRLVDLAADCDADALLVTADPVGPTCHRGTRSCFDPDGAPSTRASQGFAWLETLWSVVASRAAERPAGSYTTALLDGGVDAVARKVTEEATEVLLAAKDDAAAEAAGGGGGRGGGAGDGDRGATQAALAGEDRPATSAAPRAGEDRPATSAALAGEAADLLYHVLVLLAERGVPAGAVIEVLRARHRA